jgi:hypothetical protein
VNDNLALNVGDVLLRRKLLGFWHPGVAVGPDAVFHNTPERGEHLSSVAQFAAGESIEVRPTGADPRSVIARARDALSRPRRYNLATRNCEHTVSEILWGFAKSPTFVCAGAVILLALATYLVFRGR